MTLRVEGEWEEEEGGEVILDVRMRVPLCLW